MAKASWSRKLAHDRRCEQLTQLLPVPALVRKYRVGMIVAHQYLYQLDPAVRYAVLGNTGTLISFRLGPKDAGFIGLEFQEKFAPLDLMKLPNYHIYLRLMIDGTPSRPFSAVTLPPKDSQGLIARRK